MVCLCHSAPRLSAPRHMYTRCTQAAYARFPTHGAWLDWLVRADHSIVSRLKPFVCVQGR